MAKKSNKKSSVRGKPRFEDAPSPPGMLQDLLSNLPESARLNVLSAMFGQPAEDSLAPPRPKPRTKAQREIDCLVSQARGQDTANEALPFLLQAEMAAKKAIGKRFEKLVGSMGENAAGETYLGVRVELAQALNCLLYTSPSPRDS